MWHASISAAGVPRKTKLRFALKCLGAVGSISLGQWVENGESPPGRPGSRVVHVRRRLSEPERRLVPDEEYLDVVDVRGTPEFTSRLHAVQIYYPGLFVGGGFDA